MKPKFVVKIGGSAFDLLYYKGKKPIIKDIAAKLRQLHLNYGIVATVGGGPFADVVKGYDVAGYYKDLMLTNALKNNCLYLEFALGGLGEIIPPEGFAKVNDAYLESRIAIMYHTPEKVPLSDSDTHALSLTELLMADRLYFLKNTPGIYIRDPNINSEEPDIFVKKATIDDFLSGRISRIGADGRGEHLIETSALHYYRNTGHLHEIRIMDANNPENIEYALRNVDVGSIIVKS